MSRQHGTLALASMLVLAFSLAGCTGTDAGSGQEGGAEGGEDAAPQEEDLSIATKRPVRVEARLNDTTKATYMREIDEQNVLVLDGEDPSVLYYDLHLRLTETSPTSITVSWHLDDRSPPDAEVIGSHTLEVAAVTAVATLPVTIVPGADLADVKTRINVSLKTDPDHGTAQTVVGVVFK